MYQQDGILKHLTGRATYAATFRVSTTFLFRRTEENSGSSAAKQNMAHPQRSGNSRHQSLESLPREHQAAQWLCLEELGWP